MDKTPDPAPGAAMAEVYEFTPIGFDDAGGRSQVQARSHRLLLLAVLVPPLGLWLLWRRGTLTHATILAMAVGVVLWATAGGAVAYSMRGARPGPSAVTPITSAGGGTSAPAPVPPQPPPTVEPTPAPSLPPTAILTVRSPVHGGDAATLVAHTAAGATCSITIAYPFGPSQATGLTPKAAAADGNVSWTWTVTTRIPVGTWPIHVDCGAAGVADITYDITQG